MTHFKSIFLAVVLLSSLSLRPARAFDQPAGVESIPFLATHSDLIVVPSATTPIGRQAPYFTFQATEFEVLKGRPGAPTLRIAVRVGHDDSLPLPFKVEDLRESVVFAVGPLSADKAAQIGLANDDPAPLYMVYGGRQGLWTHSDDQGVTREALAVRLKSLKDYLRSDGPAIADWIKESSESPDALIQRSAVLALADPRLKGEETRTRSIFNDVMRNEKLSMSTKQLALNSMSIHPSESSTNLLAGVAGSADFNPGLRAEAIKILPSCAGGTEALTRMSFSDPRLRALRNAQIEVVPDGKPPVLAPTDDQMAELSRLFASNQAADRLQAARMVREHLSPEVLEFVKQSFLEKDAGPIYRRELLTAVASHNDRMAVNFLAELALEPSTLDRRKEAIAAIGGMGAELRVGVLKELEKAIDAELIAYVRAFGKP